MAMNLEKMLPLLRCPDSGQKLKLVDEYLLSENGKRYPIVEGKPILVRNISQMHITPPDHRIVSKNTSSFVLGPELTEEDAVVLHLGSGNVPSFDPRVISMDVLPNENVDIVAEAEALPFASCSLDHVNSGAVFEHVFDPIKSASEVRRVLKEGGSFVIDTAFIQGYHGFPGHYFNMTPQAAETYLVDDFIFIHSGAPQGAALHPIYHGFQFLLEKLPDSERKKMLSRPLGEVLDSIKDGVVPEPFAGRMHDNILRSFGASIAVSGRKPYGYEKLLALASAVGETKWASMKRDYYTARTALYREHEGIVFWKMRAVEDRGCPPDDGPRAEPNLHAMLERGIIRDTTREEAWKEATAYLEAERAALIEIRDGWIRQFLIREKRVQE